MTDKLKIRYVPAWLTAVADYYQTDISKLECIVSEQDLLMYSLANTMLRTKLQQLQIVGDFEFPDVLDEETYTQDDALFALYGQNPDRKTVAEFKLTQFSIKPGKSEGEVYLVQQQSGDAYDLIKELTQAVAQYCGRKVAYGSSSFRQYLNSVKN